MDTEVGEEALRPEDAGNDGGAYIHQTAVRQLLRECDPKFDLSKEEFCRHTRSVTALENWIWTHLKESAFNQCKC